MCGIFGLVFNHGLLPFKHRHRVLQFFNTMAVTAAERGTDATGVAKVCSRGGEHVLKLPEASYTVTRQAEWQGFVEDAATAGMFALMGHTRRKTHGLNTVENAHPFKFETQHGVLVGAHNGVITNHYKFAPTTPLPVDSANLLHKLSEEGSDQWPTVLSEVLGSFALSLYRNGTFFLARNDASPCVLVDVPALNATAYASTANILYAAGTLAGVRMANIRELKSGRIVEFRQYRTKPFIRKFVPAAVVERSLYEAWWDHAYPAAKASEPTPVKGTHTAPTSSTSATITFLMCVKCWQLHRSSEMQIDDIGMLCDKCADARKTRSALLAQARSPNGLTQEQAMRISAEVMRD